MSEVKEICPKCGSAAFGIVRDMTSRRVCKCGHGWAAPEVRVHELTKEIERLKQCCKDFEFVLEGSRAVKQSDEMLEKREDALMRALDWEK